MWQDLRFGIRMLRRSPGVSVIAVLCLIAGIGANTAVFSWVEGILFRPFGLVAHQDRMVAVTGEARGQIGESELSWPDFQDLARGSSFAGSSPRAMPSRIRCASTEAGSPRASACSIRDSAAWVCG